MTFPVPAIVEGERDKLPVSALLALAMTGFTAILTEALPAGLLPLMSEELGVSEALAGQTVTAYAAGSLIAAIPLTADSDDRAQPFRHDGAQRSEMIAISGGHSVDMGWVSVS